MTETELTDRLREAIVLDGPDAWRTNGYLQDAQQAGLSLPDALKRAAEVSQDVAANEILFQNIRTRIARLAQPSRSHLVEQDINQIINAARSLQLSPDFVRNRWIPAELANVAPKPVPKPAPAPPAEPVEPEPVVPKKEPAPPPIATSGTYDTLIKPAEPLPVVPVSSDTVVPPPNVAPPPAEPVAPPAPEPPTPEPYYPPSPRIDSPPPVVRAFTATPARVRRGETVTLEWDVANLLAVTIDDLGEGLSPQNRGWVKPSKTTDYTLFDANDNPLSTVRVEVVPRDRSGMYGVVFALVLLALIYWFIRNSTSRTTPEPERRERTSVNRTESASAAMRPSETGRAVETTVEPDRESVDEPPANVPNPDELATKTPAPPAESMAEPVAKPTSPADARQGRYEEAFGGKPYDKVELGADERGWRRARSKGRWGYIDQHDEWVIEPTYEAVTPFRGNTANVFRDGQLITIDRSGEVVRN